MSESKTFKSRNLITMNEQKKEKKRNLPENVINDNVIYCVITVVSI